MQVQLAAAEELTQRHKNLDVVFIERGGRGAQLDHGYGSSGITQMLRNRGLSP